MRKVNRLMLSAGTVLAAALVWTLAGCSSNPTPMTSSTPVMTLQRTSLAKVADGEDAISDSAKVSQDTGASMALGDSSIGTSTIDVPADAVDPATSTLSAAEISFVKMKVNRIGAVSAELGPHGLHFKKAVMFVLSYRGADLNGIDESKLRAFYFNPDTQALELVPGSYVDTQRKRVIAPLWHFSQYIIGSNG